MKILVVDDEHLINRYIVQCIEQSDCGAAVVGGVTSGARALQVLDTQTVDLVFADITMPKMNGLDLLKMIKDRYPDTMVIMLTCHNDFEFARIAMQHQAERYVLKTELTPESMRGILFEAQHRRSRRGRDQIDRQVRRQHALKHIVTGEWAADSIVSAVLRQHGILLRPETFIAVCIRHTEDHIRLVTDCLAGAFENITPYEYDAGAMVLLANLKPGTSCLPRSATSGTVRRHLDGMADQLPNPVGCSAVYHQLSDLGTAINEAVSDMNAFYYGGSVYSENEAMYLRDRSLVRLCEAADLHVQARRVKAFAADLLTISASAATSHPSFVLLRERLCGLIRSAADQSLPVLRMQAELLNQTRDFASLHAVLSDVVDQIRSASAPYSKLVQSAVDYIDVHFRSDVMLGRVSAEMCVNSAYLSRQFKKEVGMTFSEYLTQLRMQKARNLLETTELRISEIADEVGIGNISYFSTLFRKQYGCSPKDIRRSL